MCLLALLSNVRNLPMVVAYLFVSFLHYTGQSAD
jgi:hypothetical protein